MTTIGVIGTGMIGGTLARLCAQAGHEVLVANSRDPHTLAEEFAPYPGITPVWARQAAADPELTVVSVPYARIPALADSVFEAPTGPAVIDTGNYYAPRDGALADFDEDTVDSVWVSQTLSRPVYKAFNTLHAFVLERAGRPAGVEARVALPVAGPADAGKQMVLDLVASVGFDPTDAGPLEESWRQQMGTPVFLAELDAAGVGDALAAASRSRPTPQVDDMAGLVEVQHRLKARWNPSERLVAAIRASGIDI